MANDVFANGREISCKKADGKSIAAFPDVCMTPPTAPPTPPGVPIPYPNTAMAKDTAGGSKTVKITGAEVMLKNKSYYKTSVGDEAGSAPKKGVMSSKIKGKAYFSMWSMDVKFEGANVCRHMDMTTHNHGSSTNGPMTLNADRMALLTMQNDCTAQKERINDACDPWEEKAVCPPTDGVDAARERQATVQAGFGAGSPERGEAQEIVNFALEQYAMEIQENDCQRELRCALTTYSKGNSGRCCPPQTPEHLVPASQFGAGRGAGHPNYSASQAACSCAEGGATAATHGRLGGKRRKYMIENGVTPGQGTWSVASSAKCGAHALAEVEQHCDAACIEAQLLANHRQMGIDDSEQIRTVQSEDDRNIAGFAAEHGFIGNTAP